MVEPDFAAAVTRRGWLKAAAAGVAGALLNGCATGFGPREYRRPYSALPFSRPLVSEERVLRTRVGLRPFRAGGFVVRGERLGDKVLIHNYGHGGGGITMSWGSAELAVRELPDLADRRAAVLGCGVIGLTTARLLQARGWQVTLYARELPPDTTSNVAGGLWAPTSVFRRDGVTPAFAAQFAEALKLSHQTFSRQVGSVYGVNWRENYYLGQWPQRAQDYYYLDQWPELFPGIVELTPDQHPFPVPYALHHLSLLIEPAIFLPRLLQELQEAGGRVVMRTFTEPTELQTLPEPVVFNCTGLGAALLFGDTELTPVRGQILLVQPDPRIDFVTHGSGEGALYMFPRSDGLLLGGSFERGATHLEPDPEISSRILREHARMFAAMRL